MKLTVTRTCGHTETVVRYGGHYDDQLRWLREGTCTDCYRDKRRAEAVPTAYIRLLPGCPETPTAPEIPNRLEVYVLDSYAIKDLLKGHGYMFRGDGYSRPGPGQALNLTARTLPAWVMALYTEAAATTEIAWLEAHGIQVVILHQITSLLQSVVEGRGDLVSADLM